MGGDEKILDGIHTCTVLVRYLLACGMDCIKNLKVKNVKVMCFYCSGS